MPINNYIDFIDTTNLAMGFKNIIKATFTAALGWNISTFFIPHEWGKAINIYVKETPEIENRKILSVQLTMKQESVSDLRANFKTMESKLVGYNYDISNEANIFRVLKFLPTSERMESYGDSDNRKFIVFSRFYECYICKINN